MLESDNPVTVTYRMLDRVASLSYARISRSCYLSYPGVLSSARLTSGQYCPIAKLGYPQLEREIFCGIYYLRHLCDETRFPDWPVKEPVVVRSCC